MLCVVWGKFFSVRVFYARNFLGAPALGRRQGARQGRQTPRVICASARQSIHYPWRCGHVPRGMEWWGWGWVWVGGRQDRTSVAQAAEGGSDGGWAVTPIMRQHTVHARALLSRLPDAAPPPCQLWQPKGDHNHEHKEHCADGICGAAAKYDKYNTHMGMPGH